MEETLCLSGHDKKLIKDIVSHYPTGDRVKILRFIFKSDCTFNHYLYLGQVIGEETRVELGKKITGQVFRMETLRLLN